MWFVFAIFASLLWGLTYVIQERLFKDIDVTTYLTIISFVAFIFFACFGILNKTISTDIKNILHSKVLSQWMFLAVIIYVLAELSIGYSIFEKNAAISGLIEVSYPMFIILFSWWIFGASHLTITSAIGGSFVMIGIVLIGWFNV